MPGLDGKGLSQRIQKAQKRGLFPASLLGYSYVRIKRVCRSTLATEAYYLSEASAGAQWARSLSEEVLRGKHDKTSGHWFQCALAVDAKALFDHLTSSRGTSSSDWRVSVELHMSRQELDDDDVTIRWIPTRQMVSDGLTKGMSLGSEELEYARRVVESAEYTLGPDPRAPVDQRKRSLVDAWLQAGQDKKLEVHLMQAPQFFYDDEIVNDLAAVYYIRATRRRGRNKLGRPTLEKNIYGLKDSPSEWVRALESAVGSSGDTSPTRKGEE